MAKFCEVCGKGPRTGNLVSHSNRKTRHTWNPNVQRVRVLEGLTPTTKYVCTSCLRSGKVTRRVSG